MKNVRCSVLLFGLFVSFATTSKISAMQCPLSQNQYKNVVIQYHDLGADDSDSSVAWSESLAKYIIDNPTVQEIDPITQTSIMRSAEMYMNFFPDLKNREALRFVLLILITGNFLPLYIPPMSVVATYEPPRLRFYHEMQGQLCPCFVAH